jgi:acetylornithine/succinyldiaminopimelate/putrescine aminotransferase
MSVQGSEIYRKAFRPLLPETIQIDFNDFKSLDIIDDHTACVIVEPIQAEAGVILPAKGFLEMIREKCTKHSALLVFDEVQTGFGRTGTMFAIDRFGVIPDILVLAKALGGGMPLGAFISSGEIMSSLISNPQLGHITTFGGHPLCCAAGLASLEVLIEEKLAESCRSKSELFRKELKHPLIREIRGEGLLIAVQLSNPECVQYVITNAPRYGLVLDYFLFCNDAFRIAPPLTITTDEIKEACRQLLSLLDDSQKNCKT